MHQTQSSRYYGVSYKKYAGRRYRQWFLGINPVEKCTQSFPRCYVNRRGQVTSWRILVTSLAAPSVIKDVGHSLLERCPDQPGESFAHYSMNSFFFSQSDKVDLALWGTGLPENPTDVAPIDHAEIRHDVTFISADVESQENLWTIFYRILAATTSIGPPPPPTTTITQCIANS
jgi:hypothetical protein